MHLHILSLKRRYDVQVPDQRTVSYLTNSTLLVVPLSYSRVLFGTVETVVVVGFQSQAL